MYKIVVEDIFHHSILSDEDLVGVFNDGRPKSVIAEAMLKKIIFGYELIKEGKGHDALLNGKRCEVKGINDKLYTCPSYMVGKGRTYDKEGHLKHLLDNEYYIIHDNNIKGFIIFYIIKSTEELLFGSMTYKKAIKMLNSKITETHTISSSNKNTKIKINY